MREELITSKTAELAKEKGFDIPTMFYFIGNQSEPQEEDLEKGPYNWNERAGVSCPTQSLLHRWLMEKHGVFVNVEPGKSKDDTVIWFSEVKTLKVFDDTYKQFYTLWSLGFADTYEKAMEEGLFNALKQLT